MNSHRTQQQDNAGRTKLTAVTMKTQGRRGKHIFFVQLAHDEHGEAKLPFTLHDTLLRRAHEADKRA